MEFLITGVNKYNLKEQLVLAVNLEGKDGRTFDYPLNLSEGMVNNLLSNKGINRDILEDYEIIRILSTNATLTGEIQEKTAGTKFKVVVAGQTIWDDEGNRHEAKKEQIGDEFTVRNDGLYIEPNADNSKQTLTLEVDWDVVDKVVDKADVRATRRAILREQLVG